MTLRRTYCQHCQGDTQTYRVNGHEICHQCGRTKSPPPMPSRTPRDWNPYDRLPPLGDIGELDQENEENDS